MRKSNLDRQLEAAVAKALGVWVPRNRRLARREGLGTRSNALHEGATARP